MESNLLKAIKLRVMEELRDSVQQHVAYRDKVNVYHKFGFKERPMMGVVLKNASASRIKLSADDYAGELKSHLALAREKNKEGKLLEWVWEDSTNLTKYANNEDISSQIDGISRIFTVSNRPIISGYNNTETADNFRQIELKLNGSNLFAEYVEGTTGSVILPYAPTVGDTLTVSYYYKNLTPAGRYYVGILNSTQYIIDPLYEVKDEVVIDKTSRTELTATLDNNNVIADFVVLYHQKSENQPKFYLEQGADYTVDSSGNIIFIYQPPFFPDGSNNPEYTIRPFPVNTTLYANYRWQGDPIGPRTIPKEFQYDNEALPGVTLCFSNQIQQDDRQVVIVYKNREAASKVYSGHWEMSFDIEVFARDPIQLPDLTDHIIDDMWSRKRNDLISEGLTMEELSPNGEVEEAYDENTGDLYYKNSITLNIMTEWKRFVPFLTRLLDYDINIYQYSQATRGYILLTDGDTTLSLDLVPSNNVFEVKYPKVGFSRYY